MARDAYLFTGPSWSDVDRHQRDQMRKQIEAVDADRLLNTAVDDLATYFSQTFDVEVPTLLVDDRVVDQHEVKIDVSRDFDRMITDRSRPFYVAGSQVVVEVPFTGEAEGFKVRPNPYSLNPPVAEVRNSRVVFSISGTNLDADRVRAEINSRVEAIQSALTNLRSNSAGFGNALFEEAKRLIESRRAKLLAGRSMVASLGFKMKERLGSPKTFAAPEVRRKLAPVMPTASAAPYAPEPAMSNDDYEHILNVMNNMTQVMECAPSAFMTIDEEALRSHFLAQLNGHYEGQATGETFNYEGKTDILIRSGGKNIFIAECKFWGGPKLLAETIDQLLGYSAWRDTKIAVVVFNRNKDFSRVLTSIAEVARSHPQYKRDLPGSTETAFRSASPTETTRIES